MRRRGGLRLGIPSDVSRFSYDQVRRQAQCWNCRGFGHVREACPSETGTRAVPHVASLLQTYHTASKGGGRGYGKGSSKGQGQRQRAGRGKGAVACYVEDNQAYDLDGAFINLLATDDPGFYEHDEDANTALVTRVDAVKSDSDGDDDGTAFVTRINATKSGSDGNDDGWLGLISDDEH